MIPRTVHGLDPFLCLSAMQKAVRRSNERLAMECAVEMLHTSKAFFVMTANRLEVVCHEDLDTLTAPHVVPFVAAALAQAKERYAKSIGEARLMIGNVIRMMCAAPKSRAGCHFAAAIGLASELEAHVPTIPDHAFDQHTLEGRRRGRGLQHFREHGALLIPPPTEPDDMKPQLTSCGRSSSGASATCSASDATNASARANCPPRSRWVMLSAPCWMPDLRWCRHILRADRFRYPTNRTTQTASTLRGRWACHRRSACWTDAGWKAGLTS